MREIIFLLLGSALTALGGIVVAFFRTRARRADLVYEKRVDRLFELEELAGHLTEHLGGWSEVGPEEERLAGEFRRIRRLSGSFRRYENLTQATRRFLNSSGRILARGGREGFAEREEQEEAVREISEAFDGLVSEIDRALSEHRTFYPGGSEERGWLRRLLPGL